MSDSTTTTTTTTAANNNPGTEMAAAVDIEVAKYRKLQEEMGQLQQTLQALMGQENENEMVKRELDLLDNNGSNNAVFKMVGPVLLKNDLEDAKLTVDKRLEFIRGEKNKTEESIKQKQTLAQECGRKAQELQGLMQRAAVEAAQQAVVQAQAQKQVVQA